MELATRTFEVKQWAHSFWIKAERIRPGYGLERRIERAAKYLHERWTRTHPDWPNGGICLNVIDSYHDDFVRNRWRVVVTWHLFDDVPDEYRDTLEHIAAGWVNGEPPKAWYVALTKDAGQAIRTAQ